jgi:exopolysaccharide/PEP-CTERM locus tyrosine autokinase
MDIIEQAAKRLEELRRAGVELPEAPESARQENRKESSPSDRFSIPNPSAPAVEVFSSRRIELDMAALATRGIVTPDADRSQLADELRVLKRPLLRNVAGKSAAPVKDANLIMITSAVPAEGKTHLATNLAMSIAMEFDHTVLLVDADVARPSIPAVLDIGRDQKGLLDVLQDPALDLSQVLLRTNIEKLSILPAGTQHPRATELLASDAMNNLLADMATRYADRIIIFDSPPLLLTTEARALATHMGQVVLVVKAESTTHAMVKNAVATLEACPVKMVVLNQAVMQMDGHGYGYGYGYGYGHSKRSGRGEADRVGRGQEG